MIQFSQGTFAIDWKMNTEASAGIARLKNIAYFDFVGITPDMFCSYLGIFYMHGKKGYGMCNGGKST